MNVNNISNDLNLKKNDFIYLLFVLIFSLSIFLIKFNFFTKIGIASSDTIIYLCDALYFAGINFNNIGGINFIYNSPVICFLTSLLYRFGFSSPLSIIIVTGFFEILGNVGLYIFLKNKFNPKLSVMGTIFYSSTALVIYYSTMGMLDIAAVSVSVWILIFTILAVDKNCKYYLVALPLTSFGIFIRPTVGFILPLMLLIFFSRYDILKLFDNLISDRFEFKKSIVSFFKSIEFKYILISSFIAIFIVAIIIVYISNTFNVHYGLFDSVNGSMNAYHTNKSWDFYYNEDYLFFIKLIPQFIILEKFHRLHNFVYVIFITIILGFVLNIVDFLKNRDYLKENMNNNYYKTSNYENILKGIALILIIVSIFCFKINYMISEVALFVAFLIFGSIIKKFDVYDDYKLYLINFAWLLFYLIFISFIFMKVDRYFIPVLIPITYILIYYFERVLKFINQFFERFENPISKINSKLNISNILIVLFIMILMFNAFHMTEDNIKNTNGDTYNEFLKNTHNGAYYDYKNVSDYLIRYDSNYQSKNITTDGSFRFYDWFLNKPTDSINLNFKDISLFDSCGSDYIILDRSHNFENYTEIYKHGNSHLYEKIY